MDESAEASASHLHGLERELFILNGSDEARRLVRGGDDRGGKGGGSDPHHHHVHHEPCYTDLLHAQMAMQRRLQRRHSRRSTATEHHGSANSRLFEAINSDNNIENHPPQSPPAAADHAPAAANLRRPSLPLWRSGYNPPSAEEERVASALAAHARRGSVPVDDHGWEDAAHELELIDEEGHYAEGHDAVLPWYTPPVQRQRWGEDQILPHVNWGDLFFDLFYVAMAYNLGVMIMSAMNKQDWLRGTIYYVGTFGPLYGAWEVSTFHQSRYTSVDYSHRAYEVVRFIFVGGAVAEVKAVNYMQDPKSVETMFFIFFISGEALMHLLLCVEVYFKGLGDREAIQNHTLTKIKIQLLPVLLLYLVAFATAIFLYYQPDEEEVNVGYDEDGKEHRHLASTADDSSYGKYESESGPLWKLSDLPLTLMAIAYLISVFITIWRRLRVTDGNRGNIKHRYVPENVDYMIHRYGEWIMLMMGEGILSLLIVDVVGTAGYYIIVIVGILTMTFISILKFESEPSHGNAHAMWRNLRSSMCYGYLIQVLSMSLILFGVTYKIFLKALVKDAKKESDYAYPAYDGEESGKEHRMLAASPVISDVDSALAFTTSLAVILLSLGLMSLTHLDLKEAFGHFVHRTDGGPTRLYWPIIIIVLFNAGVILFTLTMHVWTTDPVALTICGCLFVLAFAVTRVLNYFFVLKKQRREELLHETHESGRREARASLDGEMGQVTKDETSSMIVESAVGIISGLKDNQGSEINDSSGSHDLGDIQMADRMTTETASVGKISTRNLAGEESLQVVDDSTAYQFSETKESKRLVANENQEYTQIQSVKTQTDVPSMGNSSEQSHPTKDSKRLEVNGNQEDTEIQTGKTQTDV